MLQKDQDQSWVDMLGFSIHDIPFAHLLQITIQECYYVLSLKFEDYGGWIKNSIDFCNLEQNVLKNQSKKEKDSSILTTTQLIEVIIKSHKEGRKIPFNFQ